MSQNFRGGLICLFFFLVYSADAQNVRGYCGTKSSPIADAQLDANIQYLATHNDPLSTRAITYVPIRFTIVRPASGSGGVAIKNIFRLLCKLNEDYADQEIQFYMKDDFKYLNNDAANTDPQNTGANILRINKDASALNMFFVADIKSNDPGSILGFFSPDNDYVVIKNSEVNYSAQTTSHELGHFFSLRHTFYGWECDPWNEADHGKTVTLNMAPCFNVPVELVNGSNCATASDKVCDTPPDYNFGYGWPNDCRNFNVDVFDRNDELIRPSQNNFMSYFFGCTGYHFTQGQKNLIRADLNSAKRNYLKSTYVPPATTISPEVNYLSPIDSGQVLKTEPITLTWEPVAGATFYIVEYSRNKSFGSAVTVVELVKATQAVIPASFFPGSIEYGYWRVTAMNEYATCNIQSEIGSFKLVSVLASKQIDGLHNWSLKPSIINQSGALTLEIDMAHAADVNVIITSISGAQVAQSHNHRLTSGKNNVELNDLDLAPGAYLVTLKNSQGISSKKLLVQ